MSEVRKKLIAVLADEGVRHHIKCGSRGGFQGGKHMAFAAWFHRMSGLAMVFATVGTAHADFALYGSHTSGSFGEWGLLSFDVPITGKSTRIGGGGLMFDMDFSPDGELFAPGGQGLTRVDLESGVQTLIGDWGLGSKFMVSIAFAPDGTLFGVDNEGFDTSLYKIHTDTGKATKVGNVGDFVFGIDFDPAGNLYGASGSVFPINPLTGQRGTDLIPFDAFITGLDWGADGRFRGVENFTSSGGSALHELHIASGVTTLLGATTEPDMEGIASIPGPSTLVILTLCATGMMRRCRQNAF